MLPFALYNGSLFMARCMVGSAMGLQPMDRTRSANGQSQSPGRDILKILVPSVRASFAYLLSTITRLSFLRLLCCQWLFALRFVLLPATPQRMQQHRQFASQRYHGPLFGVFSSALHQFQSEGPQIAVRSKRPQNVIGATDQKPPQIPIPMLGNTQLLIRLPGLIEPRDQSKIGAYHATLGEPLRFFQRQHIRQRRQRPNSAYLAQPFCRRIFSVAASLIIKSYPRIFLVNSRIISSMGFIASFKASGILALCPKDAALDGDSRSPILFTTLRTWVTIRVRSRTSKSLARMISKSI